MESTITPDPTPVMTIDDLAGAAGTVVSTVRLYQNKGLLPPPTKRGRVGYYDAAHVNRLRLIGQLQGRGFSLAGIKELLDGMERGESLQAILGIGDRPSTWTAEQPQAMSPADLAGFLPQVELTPEIIRRIVDLGLVDFSDDTDDTDDVNDRVIVRSPSFLHVGSQLAALGVPPAVILDEYEALRADAERIAGRFTGVFRAHLWEPFVENGMPAERVTELVGALEQLGPLAEAVVVMTLRNALQDVAERFVRAEAERLGVEIPTPGHAPPAS